MSQAGQIATGETKISGGKFRTTVPKEIREALDVDVGDKIRWVYHDDELRVYKKE